MLQNDNTVQVVQWKINCKINDTTWYSKIQMCQNNIMLYDLTECDWMTQYYTIFIHLFPPEEN